MANLLEAALTPTQSADEFTPRSSFLEHVKYDRQSNTLDIHFKTGNARRHLFCFPATFETFKQAPDHSSFYARVIKGKLLSIPLVNKNIGKEISQPLKAHRQRRTLNAGITRLAGTVNRAFAA